MPYKKRYVKKKYSRPGYRACGSMVASDAQKALALAKYLKGIVNVEYKIINTTGTGIAITVAPIITPISNIQIGDTNLLRDGSNLKVVSLRWAYTIVQHASAVATSVRCLVVKDNQTNGAIYVGADVLTNLAAGIGINSPRNLDNLGRFSVLYDKVHTFSDSGSVVAHRRVYKKQQVKLRYSGNAGDITDLSMQSYSLFFLSNETTNQPTITFHNQLRFVDN